VTTSVWTLYPELYSKIILGTLLSPGIVTLSGHNRDESWDVQAAKGSEGATSVLNGKPVGTFQASFFLADQDEEDDWVAFQTLIESTTAGPKPVALPIYHPDLAANGYTEVCSAGVGGAVRDERGGVTIQVKFIEYRPPKPKPAASPTARGGGTGAPASGGGAPPYDPNAAAKRELAGLLDEAGRP